MSAVLLSVVCNEVTLFTQSAGAAGRCDTDLVHGMSKGFQQIIQEEPSIDAHNARLYGRGGVIFSFRFTAEREHDSVQAAATFVNGHPDTMPIGVGTATIQIGGSSDTFPQGAVRSMHVRMEKNRSFADYELILVKEDP